MLQELEKVHQTLDRQGCRNRNLPDPAASYHDHEHAHQSSAWTLREYNDDERLRFIYEHETTYFKRLISTTKSNLTSTSDSAHNPGTPPTTLIDDARDLNFVRTMPVTGPGPEPRRNRGSMNSSILTPSPPSKRSNFPRDSRDNTMIPDSDDEDELTPPTASWKFKSKLERPASSRYVDGCSSGTSSTTYESPHPTTRQKPPTLEEEETRWGYYSYYRRPASNFPQFESPERTDVPITRTSESKSTMKQKPGIFGGARPVNRLGAQDGPRETGERSRTSQKRPKTFDLTSSPNTKRPKTSANLMTKEMSMGTVPTVVNLTGDGSPDRHIKASSAPLCQDRTLASIGSGVQEYKTVETMVGVKESKKRYPRHQDHANQSYQRQKDQIAGLQQSPDSEIIEIDKPQTATASTGYKGTANRIPARPPAERYHRSRSRSGSVQSSTMSEMASPYFSGHAHQVFDSRRGSTASLTHSHADDRLDNDGPKTEEQYVEEDSLDPISSDHYMERRTQKNSKIMAPYAKTASSKSADIPPSQFTNGSRSRTIPKSGVRRQQQFSEFIVVYALAGTKVIPCGTFNKPLTLRFDSEDNCWKPFFTATDILGNGVDFPELTIKPSTINRITCHDASPRLFILRAASIEPQVSPQLCLELSDASSSERFVQEIQRFCADLKVEVPPDRSKLDHIFEKKRSIAARPTHKSGDDGKLEDLQLMEESKRRRGNKQCIDRVEISGKPPHHLRSSVETEQPRSREHREFLSRKNQKDDTSYQENSAGVQLDRESTQTRGREALVTRSAARSSQKARTLSPGPVRWTVQNPEWKQMWTGKAEMELSYPFDHRSKANVSIDDIPRLDDDQELNDNLVAFYLRYLEHDLEKTRPDLASRIYFSNSFFYKTLTGSGRRGISYDSVKRWTSKVDIFSYDYIIVPICEANHWYVAIICNAPRLIMPEDLDSDSAPVEDGHGAEGPQKSSNGLDSPNLDINGLHISSGAGKEDGVQNAKDAQGVNNEVKTKDEGSTNTKSPLSSDAKKGKRRRVSAPRKLDPNEPRVITLDSLNAQRSPACTNLKNWLIAEAESKRGLRISIERLGMTARGLPEQQNGTDCGVFVLAYVEQFLKDPDAFITDILEGKRDLEKGWDGWTEQKIPNLRHEIRDLIFTLRKDFVAFKKSEKMERLAKKAKQEKDKHAAQSQATISNTVVPEYDNEPVSSQALPQSSNLPETQAPLSDQEQTPAGHSDSPPGLPSHSQTEDGQSPEASLGQRLVENAIVARSSVRDSSHESLHDAGASTHPSITYRLANEVRGIKDHTAQVIVSGDEQKRKEISETPDRDIQSQTLSPQTKKQRFDSPSKSNDTNSPDVQVTEQLGCPDPQDLEELSRSLSQELPRKLDRSRSSEIPGFIPMRLTDLSKSFDGPGSLKSPFRVEDSQDPEPAQHITDSDVEELALGKNSYSKDSELLFGGPEDSELIYSKSSPMRSPIRQREHNGTQSQPRPTSSRIMKRNRSTRPGTPLIGRNRVVISPPRSGRSSTQPSSPITDVHATRRKTKSNSAAEPIDIVD